MAGIKVKPLTNCKTYNDKVWFSDQSYCELNKTYSDIDVGS